MSERRVESLLRIRSLQERVARGAVARARYRASAASAAEQQIWASLQDASTDVAGTQEGAMFLAAQHNIQAGLSLARLRRSHAERRADELRSEMHAWEATAQRLEATERLSAREAEATAAMDLRRANHEMDEVAGVRHTREAQS
ncbi:MAG: hypothetical protein ACOYMR_13985 [Ilumatobacteraceae bacterium]